MSVTEAGTRLGVSERTARRLAGRLAVTDIRLDRDGHGHAVRLVRLTAILSARDNPVTSPSSNGQKRPVAVMDTDSVADSAGHDRDGQEPGATSEMVETLRELIRSERRRADDLNAALERAQSLHLATASELQALRQRAERIEAENRTLRAIEAKADQGEVFPPETVEDRATGAEPVPEPETAQNQPTEASGGDTEPGPIKPERLVGNEGTYDPIYRQQEQKAETKRRGWWPWGRKA